MKLTIKYQYDTAYNDKFPYWAKATFCGIEIKRCGESWDDARTRLFIHLDSTQYQRESPEVPQDEVVEVMKKVDTLQEDEVGNIANQAVKENPHVYPAS